MKRILVLAAAMAAACGGGSSGADHNQEGSGSSTLLVTGNVTVTVSSTTPTANYSFNVKDGSGANVTGATVTVGGLALTDAGSGNYTSSQTTYPSGDLSLSVVKGTDKVQGVVLGNPGAHAINAPVAGTPVTANAVLHVTWTTPEVAKAATVRMGSGGFTNTGPDTGAFDIPATSVTARANQTVTVTRTNEVAPAGGLPGSLIRVTFSSTTGSFAVQ
jgi:hypothetical protein